MKKNNGKQARVGSKIDRISGIVFILAIFAVTLFLVLSPDTEKGNYSDFLDALGMRESSDQYSAQNRFGYLGRYQMGPMALQDAGFLDSDGEWTSLANGYGIFSELDFLQSSEGQNAAIRACHTKLCAYIRSYDLDAYVGTRYCGVEVTQSGLLAACHLVGVNSMKAALRDNEMVYDGNQVPASEYMKIFAGYDISEVWGGNP